MALAMSLLLATWIALLAGPASASTTPSSAVTYRYDGVPSQRAFSLTEGSFDSSLARSLSAVGTAPVERSKGLPRRSLRAERSQIATNAGPDFVAGPIGSERPVPVSQSRMAAGFDDAGFPSTPTDSPGTSYTLPDGSKARLMEPSGQAPRRASFTNGNNGAINPLTGKPIQPPAPPGVSMKDWVRALSHVEQGP